MLNIDEIEGRAKAAGPWTVDSYRSDVLALCARVREESDRADRAEHKIAGLGDEFRASLARESDQRAALALVSTGTDGVWRWQGDGGDHPESLSCPVVMSADTLRGLVADGARVREMEAIAATLTLASLLDAEAGRLHAIARGLPGGRRAAEIEAACAASAKADDAWAAIRSVSFRRAPGEEP